MHKFTPGPWAASKNDSLLFGALRGNGLEPLGFVYAPAMPDSSEIGRRAIADVRLIASSPDLLAALEDAAHYIECLGGSSDKYRKVIAQATEGYNE